MAFREKRAWIALIAWVVPFALFFMLASNTPPSDAAGIVRRLSGFAAATLGYGALLGLGVAWIAHATPRHERGKPDERERAIEWRAGSIAYGVMMAGMIVVGIVLPFERSGWAITNAALLALVVAEVVRHAAVLIAYRRSR